ncbi:MAG: hypothetical protein H6P99_860 [Holophagaceae bacterium]|nr:hypothetical protein [Holophagaceae bacterium]
MKAGLRARLTWILGILAIWTLGWLALGLRFLLMVGANPHPFLPELSYTGVMLKAVAEWAFHAFLAYAGLGLLGGLILFLWQRVGIQDSLDHHLGWKRGLWVGLGSFLWIHGLLYLDVPAALGMIQGLQHIPMGLTLLLLLAGGLLALARGFQAQWRSAWRLAGGALTLLLLLHLPHDLFRRMVPQADKVAPTERRLLVLGIDGLRQDVAEAAMPDWKAPGGCQPVVAVPATRLTWNILLGADPEAFQYHRVIPFRSELENPPQPGLLDAARAKGQRTIFLIDDSTTLSFVLSRAPFDRVYEPSGGWKHFFTVGAGSCWPVYSWAENYLTYIETTNPWSDDRSFFREVERSLAQHQWVSAHTCQLHAPFFLRRDEIQELRPWSWLLHAPRSYLPYQTLEQAEKDRYRRQGGRANPVNHYRIRVKRILNDLAPMLRRWEADYPGLSGVVTSDHGEEHTPVVTPDDTLVTFLTGIHGFTLVPDSLKVPLHPFGKTVTHLGPRDIYSWLDLRDDLGRWIQGTGPLALTRNGPEGWLLSFPTVQAVHTQPKEVRDQGGVDGAGMKPQDFVRGTYLGFKGYWFMDTPPNLDRHEMELSWALIQPDKTITFNPIGKGRYLKGVYTGYKVETMDEIPTESIQKILDGFSGKRPGPWKAEH